MVPTVLVWHISFPIIIYQNLMDALGASGISYGGMMLHVRVVWDVYKYLYG